jgi:Putative Phosphatase
MNLYYRKDCVLVRKNKGLHHLLYDPSKRAMIQAHVHEWDTAEDVLSAFQHLILVKE